MQFDRDAVALIAARSPESVGIGLVIALIITALVVAGFALSIRTRMRRTAEAFPSAVHVPIVVGIELALGSTRVARTVGDENLGLRHSTYAALAFDVAGMHVATSNSAGFGLVTAKQVSVAGFGRTQVGSRSAKCLNLRVATNEGDVELPVVPIRLKNPLRQLAQSEFEQLASDISAALAGRSVESGRSG